MELILKVPGLIAPKPITSVFSKGSRSTSCLGNVQLLREARVEASFHLCVSSY